MRLPHTHTPSPHAYFQYIAEMSRKLRQEARAEACDFVPAGLPGVITVAAADVIPAGTHAYPWTWSNYGQCVDIWAPGVDIEGAAPECFECTAIYSGTSQATPLVSGLIASHLAMNPTHDNEDVKLALQDSAVLNLLEVLGHPYDTTPKFFAQVCLFCRHHRRLPLLCSHCGAADLQW